MDTTGSEYLDFDADTSNIPDQFDCVDDGCCEGPVIDESSTQVDTSVTNFDTDGDGQIDQSSFDTNRDGLADTWSIDTNGDLIADQTAFDTTGDGVADTWNIDADQDGIADATQYDTNGDGLPEQAGAPVTQLPQDPFAEAPASEPTPQPNSDSGFSSGDETLDSILERAERTTDPEEKERLLEFAQKYQTTMINMGKAWL